MEVLDTLQKLPPQDLEAETSVLGAMLIDSEAIAKTIELLDEESFYKTAHKKLFSSIIELFDNSEAVDLVTVADKLRREGCLDAVGGVSYITQLTASIPTAANVIQHAKIVREKSIVRRLIQIATTIAAESYSAESDVDELLDRSEKMIFDIITKKTDNKFIPMKELIKDSIDVIDKLYQRKEHITGVPTGFHELDVITAGLQSSDLIIVAGRPSMGKSAFVANIMEHAALTAKLPVAFFSLEMSKEQLVQRMLCSIAKVNAHKIRTGFLSQADWPKLTNAAGKLSEAPIFIDDTPSMSVLELRAKARRFKSQHDIQMVVVDYLQLIPGRGKADNRQQEITEISRSLKALAREINVPLIAISQLSRAVEQRHDHRPQLSDLRESGAIEQDADVVMLLVREEYYNPTDENRGMAEVIVAKQRNGPVGSVELAFTSESARFENLSRRSI